MHSGLERFQRDWPRRMMRLVPLPQIPGKHLDSNVVELIGHAVGEDDVCGLLESVQVPCDGDAIECLVLAPWLVDEHILSPLLESRDDALDRALAEVVAAALHHETIDAHAFGVSVEYLSGDEVLAGLV